MDLGRRTFLSGLAAAGTSVLAASKVTVGANPWVYAATRPQNDVTPILDSIFADLSYAGMDGIELMHTTLRPDDSVARIGELSRKHKLRVIGSSYTADMWNREKHSEILDDAHLVSERLKALGGRTLGTSVGSVGRRQKTVTELDAQAELLRKVMAVCRKNRVELNLHNHIYEVANQQYDVRGTLARIPDVKLGPDLAWVAAAGIDPVAFIRQHGRRIVFAHLRDRNKDGTWSEAMGEGDLDHGAIGEALRARTAVHTVVIELAHPRDFVPTRPLRESFKMSREFVRRVMHY